LPVFHFTDFDAKTDSGPGSGFSFKIFEACAVGFFLALIGATYFTSKRGSEETPDGAEGG
jgi:hypothetical protein